MKYMGMEILALADLESGCRGCNPFCWDIVIKIKSLYVKFVL